MIALLEKSCGIGLLCSSRQGSSNSHSTSVSVEALLERLDAVGANSIGATDLSKDELKLLKAVGDYALDGCPIEGGMMRDDGSLITRAELKDFREKIGALTPATVER